MMYIGKDVQVIDPSNRSKRSACLADESHCAIIISYSGRQERNGVEVAKFIIKKYSIYFNYLYGRNSISRLADVHLSFFKKYYILKYDDFASTTSLKYY